MPEALENREFVGDGKRVASHTKCCLPRVVLSFAAAQGLRGSCLRWLRLLSNQSLVPGSVTEGYRGYS